MSDDTANHSNTPNEDTDVTPAEGKSRRAVLKAAVIGSAAVAAVAGAGTAGLALTGKKPSRLFAFGNNQASGSCISLSQGGKFSPNNPNNFLQVNAPYLSQFGTLGPDIPAGNADAGKPTIAFDHCGSGNPINFVLTDKNHTPAPSISGQLVEFTNIPKDLYTHQENNGDLYLVYLAASLSGDTGHQFPEGSCLTLSCPV